MKFFGVMKTVFLFICLSLSFKLFAQWPSNYSPSYDELIDFYSKLALNNEEVELYSMGLSDAGKPIHLIILNGEKDSLRTFEKCRAQTTILINNGIHPGEPDGINACTQWVENWVKQGKKTKHMPVVAIIPVYNVGGMLNRGTSSRANQNGPSEYGFRGNAQNLDLNRDFIKMDSKNATSFVRIFQALDPDVFVDTHVSNGADYQYTLTLIHSLKQRQTKAMQELMTISYYPALKAFSKKTKWDWIPYVETKAETPDSGLVAFDDLPRYAQGYATLFHTVSVTVETHMLKPFDQRVQATYDYLDFLITWTKSNSAAIENTRKKAIESNLAKTSLNHHFQLTSKCDSLLFKGYTAEFPKSELTGLPRLRYNRNKPYSKYIPYYNDYSSTDSVSIPKYYIVSQECKEIIARLKWNQIDYKIVQHDSLLLVHSIRVRDFNSPAKPYEGHFLHSKTDVIEQSDTVIIPAGSLVIPTYQVRRNFLVSVLEPEMEDSYFAWNFMDSYVQGKEYFSAYVFEDLALEILKNNPLLEQEFNDKKLKDPVFNNNTSQQLYFIYKNSPYFERSTYMRLPIFKLY